MSWDSWGGLFRKWSLGDATPRGAGTGWPSWPVARDRNPDPLLLPKPALDSGPGDPPGMEQHRHGTGSGGRRRQDRQGRWPEVQGDTPLSPDTETLAGPLPTLRRSPWSPGAAWNTHHQARVFGDTSWESDFTARG